MEFNAKKCEVLKLARTRSIIDKDYYLGGTKLDRIDVKKDLWVLKESISVTVDQFVSHDLT